jgi:hypothetical protein
VSLNLAAWDVRECLARRDMRTAFKFFFSGSKERDVFGSLVIDGECFYTRRDRAHEVLDWIGCLDIRLRAGLLSSEISHCLPTEQLLPSPLKLFQYGLFKGRLIFLAVWNTYCPSTGGPV